MDKARDSRDYKRKALALFRRHKFTEGEVKMSRGFKLTTNATRKEYLKSYYDHLISWGQQLEQKEEHEKAQNKFRRANIIFSGQPTTLFNLGNILYRQGKCENAIIMYNKALSDRSLDPKIYNNWGYVLSQQGKYHEAVEMYREAVERDPEYILAYFNMVIALYYLNKKKKAEEVFGKVFRMIEECEYEIFDVVEIFEREIGRFEKEKEMKSVSRMTLNQYQELKLRFEGFKYVFDLLERELKLEKRIGLEVKNLKDDVPFLSTMMSSV